MSKDFNPPQARSWRDIPQPVKPRTMSGGGRLRLAMAALRCAAFVAVLAAVGWGALQVIAVVQENPREMPAVVKSAVVKDVVFVTDGVLDHAWVVSTLALPKNASLMELDLLKLRDRVLTGGQVRTATLTRNFPDTLAVTISERSPVARLMAQLGDEGPKELLVARDGAVFAGVGFDKAMIGTLPWLEGLTLARRGGAFVPIDGMEPVAELLAKAKLEAEHLYQTWVVVSLARLRSDGEIEVRNRDATRITFGTREDFFRQLSRLDWLLDTTAKAQPGRPLGEIDLAIGSQVPVAFAAAPTDRNARSGTSLARPATSPGSSALSNLSIKLKREL